MADSQGISTTSAAESQKERSCGAHEKQAPWNNNQRHEARLIGGNRLRC
jgi:hypothetical protein